MDSPIIQPKQEAETPGPHHELNAKRIGRDRERPNLATTQLSEF
jgi:hypothetical protein